MVRGTRPGMTPSIMSCISSQTLTIEDQSFPAHFVKGFGTHCCHGVNPVCPTRPWLAKSHELWPASPIKATLSEDANDTDVCFAVGRGDMAGWRRPRASPRLLRFRRRRRKPYPAHACELSQ